VKQFHQFKMQKSFRKIAKIALVLVYLVIVAGAIVRVTGRKEFKKGQIVIVNETLQVATKDFESVLEFKQENWETYTKHEYASFNPWHTWIEYINRLVTVVLGIPMLLLFFLSFWLC